MDSSTPHTPSALQMITATIRDIHVADAKEIPAVLLSGWNGFTMLATATVLVVEQWPDPDEPVPDRLVFLRNYNHAAASVAVRYLEQAPSLPSTDRTTVPVCGWATLQEVMDRIPVSWDIRGWPADEVDAVTEAFGLQRVLLLLPKLGFALNVGFHAASHHVLDPADRRAVYVGIAMSAEICDAWAGRLHTYLSSPDQLEHTAAGAGEHRCATGQLRDDDRLAALLRAAIARAADGDGWASIPAVGSALRAANPDFRPDRYGYPKLTELILATELFRPGKPSTATDTRSTSATSAPGSPPRNSGPPAPPTGTQSSACATPVARRGRWNATGIQRPRRWHGEPTTPADRITEIPADPVQTPWWAVHSADRT